MREPHRPRPEETATITTGSQASLRPGDAINPVMWGQMRRSKEAKSSCRNQHGTTDAIRRFGGCSRCCSRGR